MLEVGVVECDDRPAERCGRVRSIADDAEIARRSAGCDDAERQRVGGVERALVDGGTREPAACGLAGADLETDVLADVGGYQRGVECRRDEQRGRSVDEVGHGWTASRAGPERGPCWRATDRRIHATVEHALNGGDVVGRLRDEPGRGIDGDGVATENLGGVGRQDGARRQLVVDGSTGDVSDMSEAKTCCCIRHRNAPVSGLFLARVAGVLPWEFGDR